MATPAKESRKAKSIEDKIIDHLDKLRKERDYGHFVQVAKKPKADGYLLTRVTLASSSDKWTPGKASYNNGGDKYVYMILSADRDLAIGVSGQRDIISQLFPSYETSKNYIVLNSSTALGNGKNSSIYNQMMNEIGKIKSEAEPEQKKLPDPFKWSKLIAQIDDTHTFLDVTKAEKGVSKGKGGKGGGKPANLYARLNELPKDKVLKYLQHKDGSFSFIMAAKSKDSSRVEYWAVAELPELVAKSEPGDSTDQYDTAVNALIADAEQYAKDHPDAAADVNRDIKAFQRALGQHVESNRPKKAGEVLKDISSSVAASSAKKGASSRTRE